MISYDFECNNGVSIIYLSTLATIEIHGEILYIHLVTHTIQLKAWIKYIKNNTDKNS